MDIALNYSGNSGGSGQVAADRRLARTARRSIALVLALLLGFVTTVTAQAPENQRSSLIVEVLKDPTTYVPAGVLYTSMRLDWDSSQPFFRNGFVEDNARYTESGLAKDKPLSYNEGNRQILKDSLVVLPASIANNALVHMIERRLSERYPGQRKLWKTLSWVERAAFSGYASYKLSSPHFRQWQKNKQLAEQYGFVPP
jgi:hypothetical protein